MNDVPYDVISRASAETLAFMSTPARDRAQLRQKSPFGLMEVGDQVLVPKDRARAVANAVRQYAYRSRQKLFEGKVFATATDLETGDLTIVRTA